MVTTFHYFSHYVAKSRRLGGNSNSESDKPARSCARFVFVSRCLVIFRGLVVLAVFAAGSQHAVAQERAVRFGKLVAGYGQVVDDAVVIMEGERIRNVARGESSIPAGADVIDLRPLTGIPGLIDVHTHLTFGRTPGRRRSPVESMFLGQEGARRTLEAGVTTVRDMNAVEYLDIAMRNLVESGDLLGPRMLVVGYGLQITWAETGPGTADGPDEVRRVVRRNIAAGVNWIKMFGSYGGGADLRDYQTFTYEEMKAAVDATHNLGKRIAIHAYGRGSARDAVRAGADSLEHGPDMDDETIQEMVRRGTFYVPTIDHNRYYLENGEAFGWAPGYEQRLTDFIERNLETARRAHAAGVRFAMGSDALLTMFGENTRELEWFVRAGMTPEEALETATTNAAEMLGMENEIGAVRSGYYADLVAIDGDPLSDVGAIINGVRWVMKAGRVVVDKIQ